MSPARTAVNSQPEEESEGKTKPKAKPKDKPKGKRGSLADQIPDWPTLQKVSKPKKVAASSKHVTNLHTLSASNIYPSFIFHALPLRTPSTY